MRLYNTISIFIYLYPIYKYNSYRASIILFNGVIYHGILPKNKYFMTYDCFINFIISLYTVYYNRKIFFKGLYCSMLFLINEYLFYNYYISDTSSQIIHTLSIHVPFLLMLIDSHKLNKIQSITN